MSFIYQAKMSANCFRKSRRIRDEKVFKAILAKRCSAGNGVLRLFAATNTAGYCRLGVSVSKKLGNPVIRNRFKRLAREAFRLNQDKLSEKLDYLLIISPKMSKKTEPENCRTAVTSYNVFAGIFLELAAKVESRYRKNETAKDSYGGIHDG